MRFERKKLLAKRIACDLGGNPHIQQKYYKDALNELNAMLKVFGIPNPPDILLDSIVDACTMSLISQAFRNKYGLGTINSLRMMAFQSCLPCIEDCKVRAA